MATVVAAVKRLPLVACLQLRISQHAPSQKVVGQLRLTLQFAVLVGIRLLPERVTMSIDERLEDWAARWQVVISIYNASVVRRMMLCGVNHGIDQCALGGHTESWGPKAVTKSAGLEPLDLAVGCIAEVVLFWILLSVEPFQEEFNCRKVSVY